MIMWLPLSILIPLLFSYLLVGFLEQRLRPFTSNWLLKISLATGLALGISSCTYFAWFLIEGTTRGVFIISESLILVALSAALYRHIGMTCSSEINVTAQDASLSRKVIALLSVCMGLTLFREVVRFVFMSLAAPHGEVDALTMWNLRARALARADAERMHSFINVLTERHSDYPLLLPASIARWWTYIGDEPTIVPLLVAMLFTFATVSLVGSSVSFLKSKCQGILAATVLLGTPFFIKHGASQYADIPLGFYILATLVAFICFEKEQGRSQGFLVIAGLMSGFAAWTKNEGLLFVVVIVLVRLFVVVSVKGWKTYLNEIRFFATGLFPVLLVIAFFKVFIAPFLSPILVQQGATTTISWITDPSRYIEAGHAFLTKALRFGHPGLIVLVFYWLLMGRAEPEAGRAGIRTAALALSFMLAGYFMVFIITPHGLSIQVATSLDRLWIHLWPSTVFLFFLFVKTPEDVMMPGRRASSTATPLWNNS